MGPRLDQAQLLTGPNQTLTAAEAASPSRRLKPPFLHHQPLPLRLKRAHAHHQFPPPACRLGCRPPTDHLRAAQPKSNLKDPIKAWYGISATPPHCHHHPVISNSTAKLQTTHQTIRVKSGIPRPPPSLVNHHPSAIIHVFPRRS